jgi:hypothetical protein
MAFSETLIREIRRRSHFQCCLCKSLGIEIHHIVPKADGGANTPDNAAPLCPSCHETYGANPTKRKFIREARDFWFEICDKRYSSESSLLHEVHAVVTNTASKEDVSLLRAEISQLLSAFKPTTSTRLLSIPLKGTSRGGSQELTIRDLIVLVSGTSSDRPDGQLELLCMKELWSVKGGYRTIYNEFRQHFGDRIFRYLASRALDYLKIDASDGLTKEEIVKAIQVMAIEAVCLTTLDEGDLCASMNESGEVAWYTRDNAPF